MLGLLEDSAWTLPLLGVLVGVVMGGVARWSHFCTLSSLERYWYGGDASGVRTWALAIAVAILLTQVLELGGLLDTSGSYYVRSEFSFIGTLLGGLLFGLGMAFVGTCGFGALIQLGSGSLRSLVVVLVIGASALAMQQGVLSPLREALFQATSWSFAESASLSGILSGDKSTPLRIAATGAIVLLIFYMCFRDSNFRSDSRRVITGLVIGAMVAAGWLITYQLGQLTFQPVQLESASFVLPPGQLLQVLAVSGKADYGVGLVVGVVIGSAVVAHVTRMVHWEACDDPRELGRHLIGAVLMGCGGVLAAGCTIGQGISAASALAVSAPVAMTGIVLGARCGLSLLLEGLPRIPGVRARSTGSARR